MAEILVVDDEEVLREMFKDVLEAEQYAVETAENGKLGLAKMRAKNYDLVIMDWNMPEMTGIEALKQLRADPKLQNLKVIMCTSMSAMRELESAFAEGATAYLIKPIKVTALVEKVKKTLDSPSARP
jgi:two-component system chemotaxis response regulator CheY